MAVCRCTRTSAIAHGSFLSVSSNDRSFRSRSSNPSSTARYLALFQTSSRTEPSCRMPQKTRIGLIEQERKPGAFPVWFPELVPTPAARDEFFEHRNFTARAAASRHAAFARRIGISLKVSETREFAEQRLPFLRGRVCEVGTFEVGTR